MNESSFTGTMVLRNENPTQRGFTFTLKTGTKVYISANKIKKIWPMQNNQIYRISLLIYYHDSQNRNNTKITCHDNIFNIKKI